MERERRFERDQEGDVVRDETYEQPAHRTASREARASGDGRARRLRAPAVLP